MIPNPSLGRGSVHLLSVLLSVALLGACTERTSTALQLSAERGPIPVEVAQIEVGPITAHRVVSGSLEAAAKFVVAAKVSGRVAKLEVNLGDRVKRGSIVARLDEDEYGQAVLQAEADLAVARANHAEAGNALDIAKRALTRLETLRGEGVTSESQLDEARSKELASRAHLEVTEANIAHAEASLHAAKVRLGYVTVTADWQGDDEYRVVGERFVDEGGNVPSNTPLLSIVRLNPITAVLSVAERDYRSLALEQHATLSTDAYPGKTFAGRVVRIAPVFNRETRQARVELELENAEGALKPGMFVRATLDLEHADRATLVPLEALTVREDVAGVFVLAEDSELVRWVPVEVGIRDEARVQVSAENLSGRVVTLGQELCDDGAVVQVVGQDDGTAPQ